MADRVKFPPGAQRRIERLLNERDRLERRHLRALDPAMVALEAAILRAIVGRDPAAPWTIRSHARAMRALRSAGQHFGAEVTQRARQAATEGAEWGAKMQPRAMAIMATAALGKRVAVPAVDVPKALSVATPYVEARTADVGAATGEEVARAAVSGSFLSTRTEVAMAAGVVALSLAPMVMKKARDRAERVVVTEVTAAVSEGGDAAREQLVKRYPRMRVAWDSTLDKRVCALCAGLHHKVVDNGAEFAAGVSDAPAHSRCRCCTLPWLDEWTDMLDDLGIAPGERTGVIADVEIQLPSFGAPAPAEFVASRP